MSMIGTLFTMTPDEADRLGDAPAEPEGGWTMEDFDALGDAEPASPDDADDQVDLDKMWHAAGWLLHRAGAPMDPVIGADRNVGGDAGYGPAMYRTPDTTATLATFLAGLTTEDLRQAFDPAGLDDDVIYPNIWDRDPDALAEEVTTAAQTVIEFYQRAAAAGLGTATIVN